MTNLLSTTFKEAFITFPNSIKDNVYCFKLNTDDYFDAKPIDSYLRSKGIEFKRTKQYSNSKLIGWHIYKIPSKVRIKSFQDNIEYCKALFIENNILLS